MYFHDKHVDMNLYIRKKERKEIVFDGVLKVYGILKNFEIVFMENLMEALEFDMKDFVDKIKIPISVNGATLQNLPILKLFQHDFHVSGAIKKYFLPSKDENNNTHM